MILRLFAGWISKVEFVFLLYFNLLRFIVRHCQKLIQYPKQSPYLQYNSNQKKNQSMKRVQLQQINPIAKRANCKLATVGQRNYLIGGLTADMVTTDIFEFRINSDEQKPRLEWKKTNIEKRVLIFTERNSFAICPVQNKIYILGGNQTVGQQQKSLSDLIQLNTDTSKVSKVQIKNQFPIHSTILVHDEDKNELIAYGGTDSQSKQECLLYRLDLSDMGNLQWKKTRVECKQHQGMIWQHSGHLIKKSIIDEEKSGRFLLIVGGCIQPFMPYKYIVEIDLQANKVSGILELEKGVVSHDSFIVNETLYMFGGSTGQGFNSTVFKVKNGKVQKQEGFVGLGCACLPLKEGVLVYGGAKDGESFNGAFLYQDL